MKQSKKSILLHGITQNPAFVLVLGMCPLMAQTITLEASFWLGLATMGVLICSNALISLLRNIIPDKVRIPCYIVIIATFVTIVQLLIAKFLPPIDEIVGASIGLIAVNCVILGRAEGFASKNGPVDSILDGVSMGIGFLAVASLIGGTREILIEAGINVFSRISGGFLTLAIYMGLFNFLRPIVANAIKGKSRSLVNEEVNA